MINILYAYLLLNIVAPTIILLFGAYDRKKEFWFAYLCPGGAVLLILKYIFNLVKEEMITQYKKLK